MKNETYLQKLTETIKRCFSSNDKLTQFLNHIDWENYSFDDIEGKTFTTKIQELVKKCERQNKIDHLVLELINFERNCLWFPLQGLNNIFLNDRLLGKFFSELNYNKKSNLSSNYEGVLDLIEKYSNENQIDQIVALIKKLKIEFEKIEQETHVDHLIPVVSNYDKTQLSDNKKGRIYTWFTELNVEIRAVIIFGIFLLFAALILSVFILLAIFGAPFAIEIAKNVPFWGSGTPTSTLTPEPTMTLTPLPTPTMTLTPLPTPTMILTPLPTPTMTLTPTPTTTLSEPPCSPEPIVLVRALAVRPGPDPLHDPPIRWLSEGDLVNIVEKASNWYKILLEDAIEGWVFASFVGSKNDCQIENVPKAEITPTLPPNPPTSTLIPSSTQDISVPTTSPPPQPTHTTSPTEVVPTITTYPPGTSNP